MRLFVGLDVSPAKTAICLVCEHGKIVKQAQAASESEALLTWIGEQDGIASANGLEAGPLSQWLHPRLTAAGLDVVLMVTRRVKGALTAGLRGPQGRGSDDAVLRTVADPDRAHQ